VSGTPFEVVTLIGTLVFDDKNGQVTIDDLGVPRVLYLPGACDGASAYEELTDGGILDGETVQIRAVRLSHDNGPIATLIEFEGIVS